MNSTSVVTSLKTWLQALLHLFYPRQCVVCGAALQEGEEVMCLSCNMGMPRTHYHLKPDNRVEQLFWGKIPLERATSYFLYHRQSPYAHLVHRLKYDGRRDVGHTLGRFLAAEIQPSGFFRDVDVIVPVPLHPKKRAKRGYNQSEWIARGLAEKINKPMDTEHLVHQTENASQTHKSLFDRYLNMQGVFALTDPLAFAHKHVLLVDDVITTGSTLEACIQALLQSPGVKVSVFALAMAH